MNALAMSFAIVAVPAPRAFNDFDAGRFCHVDRLPAAELRKIYRQPTPQKGPKNGYRPRSLSL